MGYTILLTGASSGFGAVSIRTLAKAGHKVYAGIFNLKQEATTLQELANFNAEHHVEIHPVELDVTNDDHCKAAVQLILQEAGQLDIVIHNAGHMSFGALEAFTPEQLLQMYEVNAVGTHRLNRALLPYMRKRGQGLIVYVGCSSAQGATPPFLGPSSAAKAALDSLAISYAAEVSRWGIETSIVVPGVFPSGTKYFSSATAPKDRKVAIEYEDGPYNGMPERIDEAYGKMTSGDNTPDVSLVADAILRVVDTPFGERPLKVFVDPLDDGAEDVSKLADQKRAEYYKRTGLSNVLHPNFRPRLPA